MVGTDPLIGADCGRGSDAPAEMGRQGASRLLADGFARLSIPPFRASLDTRDRDFEPRSEYAGVGDWHNYPARIRCNLGNTLDLTGGCLRLCGSVLVAAERFLAHAPISPQFNRAPPLIFVER
ncbi:MAG: hypothetical protein QOJ99_5715 [Bryobacterales bacterium]|jgi:hypothetical protein|nr:hypothetical protein [Bryobacterales bacterium]